MNIASIHNKPGAEKSALVKMPDGRVCTLAELSGRELRAALSRDQLAGVTGSNSSPAPARAKPQVHDSRIKAVAEAVENDPACKGQAALALRFLAEDALAGASADTLIQIIGSTAAANANAKGGEDMKSLLAEIAEHNPQSAQGGN